MGAVSLCISLRILNLSYNKLVNVRLVTSLVNLEELDLSANHITSLGIVIYTIHILVIIPLSIGIVP